MKKIIALVSFILFIGGSNSKGFEQSNISIETFSDFPNEIDGCSCYFSNNEGEFKQKKYIYVNNYANLSFMKINGRMTKLILSDKKPEKGMIYEDDNYEMRIEHTAIGKSGDESSFQKGTIIMKQKKGGSITINFYGECGC